MGRDVVSNRWGHGLNVEWLSEFFNFPVLQSIADKSPLNSPTSRLNWINISAFIAIAYVCFLIRRKATNAKSFISYIFPAKIYLHEDAITGYEIYIVNKILFRILQIGIFINLADPIAANIESGLLSVAPGIAYDGAPPWAIALTVGFFLFVVQDFFVSYFHYVMHKVPLFWEFHKVHHAPRVLTPMTDFQLHPIEMILGGVFSSVGFGVALGVINSFIAGSANDITATQIFWIFGIIYLYWHFRHSHIPIYFPEWLTKYVVSPAYHQIHHSVDPKHWDKNMGVVFSFWDRLFGTFYMPSRDEEITFGLGSDEESEQYTGILRAYSRPFIAAYEMAKSRLGKAAPTIPGE